MEAPLLAYVTSTEDGAAVSFGRNYMEARRLGALELGMDYDEVDSCKRASQYDSYAPGPVPVQDLIEQFGWVFECWGCGCRVDADLEAEDDETGELREDMAPVYGKNYVYCSPGCEQREAAEKAKHAALALELKAAVEAKFPGATARMACTHNTPPSIHFLFPGGQGEGTWDFGTDKVLIQRRDIDAWHAYRDSLPA